VELFGTAPAKPRIEPFGASARDNDMNSAKTVEEA
jgi:hypothetical protein